MPQLPKNFDISDIITMNRVIDYRDYMTADYISTIHSVDAIMHDTEHNIETYTIDAIERNYNNLLNDVRLNCGHFLQSTRNILPHYNSYIIYSPSDFIYLYGYNYFMENYTLNKNVLESRIASHIQHTGVPFVRFFNQGYGYVIDYRDFIQYHQHSPEIYKLNHTFVEEDIPIVAYKSLFGGIALTIEDSNFIFRKTHTRCIIYNTSTLDIVEEAKKLKNHIVKVK